MSEFAQADTDARRQQSSVTAARAYVPLREVTDDRADVALPANLIIAETYLPVVEAMRASSPTFRQQCLRIANAQDVIVVLDRNPPLPSMAVRAWTHIQRDRDGRLRATVRIGEPNRAAELIAHEFEHIVEQLDGIDLRSKASLEATGVRQCHCADVNAFETMRAVHVGRRVAREVGERRR